MAPFKLGHLQGDIWKEHSWPPIFDFEMLSDVTERLIIGVPAGDSTVIRRLTEQLEPPYFILYLLHTPRGEGEPGRYQSPELDRSNLIVFLDRFANFLSSDARFDLWIHSIQEHATLVWDRHNILYAYGPLDKFSSALLSLGFQRGKPKVSFIHQHHYRKEFDQDAAEVLKYFAWSRSPLRPGDEQWRPT